MAKIGRNQPCPCSSGRKYKHCCWHRDGAAHVPATPAVSPHGYHLAETDLDRLSNSVVSLIDEGCNATITMPHGVGQGLIADSAVSQV